MPPHIKPIERRGSTYYLVDGELIRSLKTKKKGLAERRLEQYVQGKYGFAQAPTIGEQYEAWIKTKVPPLVRPGLISGYEANFNAHILPRFKDIRMDRLSVPELTAFRAELLAKGLKLKTVRNIIDADFRAFWRDYMEATETDRNPFARLRWPRVQRERPDPFTAEERDAILTWLKTNDFFYFPMLFVLFYTGMRPSELYALTWRDIDLEGGRIDITKSRYMNSDSAPKTSASNRRIRVGAEMVEVLKLLPSRRLGLKHGFVNKLGEPMTKKWAEHNWAPILKELNIRHRKFYSTRHTFITEAVKAGENLMAIAQYCGTSTKMIEQDYCGALELGNRSVFASSASKLLEGLVAGLGFEPRTSRL